MSFYRLLAVTVAALGLATSAFAAENALAPAADNASPAPQAMQVADTTQSTTTSTTTTTTTDKVDVNKATARELMKVKGLTIGKAKAIVSYRKKHGDFKSLDELKAVKGFKSIHEDKMKEIQDQLTVG